MMAVPVSFVVLYSVSLYLHEFSLYVIVSCIHTVVGLAILRS